MSIYRHSFETSGNTRPTTRQHIPEDMKIQQHLYKNLKGPRWSLFQNQFPSGDIRLDADCLKICEDEHWTLPWWKLTHTIPITSTIISLFFSYHHDDFTVNAETYIRVTSFGTPGWWLATVLRAHGPWFLKPDDTAVCLSKKVCSKDQQWSRQKGHWGVCPKV
jgi:hypothetical protein